ncbi:MAG: carboxypeptidase-like regulatory domain-containing protein [Candidatus Dormibacteria bacterium]
MKRRHRGLAATVLRVLVAILVLIAAQPVVAAPVAARTRPELPQAKGLGPRPGPSPTGDCRDPMPDPGQKCVQDTRLGTLSVSPHVVQACKPGTSPGNCPKITATFSPKVGGDIYSGAAAWQMSFGKCTSHFSPAADIAPGKIGGTNTCSAEATGATGGWTTLSIGITGFCGSVAAAQSGHAEFAGCLSTVASDYYAILPYNVGFLDGVVTQKDGKTPVAGVYIQIRSEDNKRSVALTDSTGYYSAFVDAGTYTVCACFFKDNRLNQGPPDRFTPDAPKLTIDGYTTQNFAEGGYNFSGQVTRKVTHPGDKPLAGVHIAFTGKQGTNREAVTDAKGKYRITVPEEAYVGEGLTPPPLRAGESIAGAPYQCVVGGVASHTAQCVLDAIGDRDNVDFVFNNEFNLELKKDPTNLIPGRNVHEITAAVTDGLGDAVAGAKVQFTAEVPVGRVVLGDPEGHLLYPTADPGPDVEGLPPGTFTGITDGQGLVVIDAWTGIGSQAGTLTVKAVIDNGDTAPQLSTVRSEQADLPAEPPAAGGGGPSLPPDLGDILDRGVRGRLAARPAPSSTAADLQATVLNSLLALSDTGNADFVPLRTADGKGGVVAYPKNVDAKDARSLAAYIAGKKTSPTSPAITQAQVIDMDEVSKLVKDPASKRIIPAKLIPLTTWAAGRTTSVGMLDKSDASSSLYLGYPSPRSVQRRTPRDKALGASLNARPLIRVRGAVAATVVQRAATLTTGAPAGSRVGFLLDSGSSGTRAINEIGGAEIIARAQFKLASSVSAPGLPVAAESALADADLILVPPGDYDITLTGTSSGPAAVEIASGAGSTPFTSFAFSATSGDTAVIQLAADGTTDQTVRVGGRTVKAAAGPRLHVQGLPQRLTALSTETPKVTVVDDYGALIAGARVQLVNAANDFHAWTGPDGTVRLKVAPLTTAPLKVTVSQLGYVPATATIAVRPAVIKAPDTARLLAGTRDPGTTALLTALLTPANLIAVVILVLLASFAVWCVRRRRELLQMLEP